MNETQKVLLHQLTMELMTHNEDISKDSWVYLRQLLEDANHLDIIDAVEATDERYYLPESFDK